MDEKFQELLLEAEMIGEDDGLLSWPSLPLVGTFAPPYASLECDLESHAEWVVYPWGATEVLAYGDEGEVSRPQIDLRGMLDRFIDLRTKEGVLRFVRRFGPLGICAHDLPCSHRPAFSDHYPFPEMPGGLQGCDPRDALERSGGAYREPIRVWAKFVVEARRTIALAAKLHAGKVPSDQCEEERWRIMLTVNRWLKLGDVRPFFTWFDEDPEDPSMDWRGDYSGFVFGPLAIELALAVARRNAWASCSNCRNMYLREGRAPQAGRENYCCACRKLDAKLRKRRQRVREAGRRL